eukprot:scaffold29074_cov109-Isochrysis_galbana.AAC.2
MPTIKGITRRDAWAHTRSTVGSWFSICAIICALVRVGKRNGEWVSKRRIIADAAAMHHSRGRSVPLFSAIPSGRGHWRGLVDTLLRMGRGWRSEIESF